MKVRRRKIKLELVARVHAKARAFVETLSGIPRSVHSMVPRGPFARDFNDLRDLALEALPGVDPRLLGRPVAVRYLLSGEEVCDATYVEIEVYARQLLQQLALALPPEQAPPPEAESGPPDPGVPFRSQFGQPWSEAEEGELVAAFDAGRSVHDLAAAHCRTIGAIRSRLMRLGKLKFDVVGRARPDPAPQAGPPLRARSPRHRPAAGASAEPGQRPAESE